MTLQIGMVGSNGIVLASDRCAGEFGSTTDICKIYHSGNSAFAFAGDDCSLHVAEDLTAAWDNQPNIIQDDVIKATLKSIAEKRYQQDASEAGDYWNNVRTWPRSILAIIEGSLWRIDIGATSTVRKSLTKSVAGDSTNLARFISEQYYEGDRSALELVFLAAHFIVMGHDRHPAIVRGLDVAVWTADNGKLRLLEQSALDTLSNRSKQLDAQLREMIYCSKRLISF